jgi:hypothetical protein
MIAITQYPRGLSQHRFRHTLPPIAMDIPSQLPPKLPPEPRKIGAMETQDFGWALRMLKAGARVARSGWNGKGMWLAYSPGSKSLLAEKFWAGPNREFAMQNGGTADVLPCITMKTAGGEILMGWLASQSDMLAEDWQLVA